MLDCATCHESSGSLEISSDNLVCLLDVLTSVVRDLGGEFTVLINWHWGLTRLDESVLDACLVILFTEAWGLVDDTCTGVSSDV